MLEEMTKRCLDMNEMLTHRCVTTNRAQCSYKISGRSKKST